MRRRDLVDKINWMQSRDDAVVRLAQPSTAQSRRHGLPGLVDEDQTTPAAKLVCSMGETEAGGGGQSWEARPCSSLLPMRVYQWAGMPLRQGIDHQPSGGSDGASDLASSWVRGGNRATVVGASTALCSCTGAHFFSGR